MTIRVLIADDHAMARDAIKDYRAKEPGIEIVADAADGDSAIALAAECAPDVALIDISTPGVGVRLTLDADTLRITVRDRGRGADTRALIAPSSASESFGLFSILERTQALGGDLDIRSEPGHGTLVVLSVPAHLHPGGHAPAAS